MHNGVPGGNVCQACHVASSPYINNCGTRDTVFVLAFAPQFFWHVKETEQQFDGSRLRWSSFMAFLHHNNPELIIMPYVLPFLL